MCLPYTVKKFEPDLAHSLEPGLAHFEPGLAHFEPDLAHLRKFQLREAFNMSQVWLKMSQTWLISLLLERLLLEKRNNYIFQKLMCL